MGYLGREEQTAETIESSGWIHSGDIGMKDEQGFYFITGRIKGTEMAFWQNLWRHFRRWLHWKLHWQLPVPAMKILSKCQHFRFSVEHQHVQGGTSTVMYFGEISSTPPPPPPPPPPSVFYIDSSAD